MPPDDGLPSGRPRPGSVLAAWTAGLLLSAAVAFTALGYAAVMRREECSGEYRPFLGSAKQTFVLHGCLARDAGPLIAIKKRLGIYDPHWMTVIR